GDQGEAVGPLRLAAGLARAGVAAGRVRPRRAGLAADRGAGRRHAQVRLLEPAAGHELGPGGAAVEKSVAGGAGVSTIERGGGAWALPGAVPGGASTPPRGWPGWPPGPCCGGGTGRGARRGGPEKRGSRAGADPTGHPPRVTTPAMPLAKPDCA